ncbi:hypothetical protein BU23DRAFT_569792 [Bimuria novae-zelandiae CBS 107.79]|uniref:Uncharacterized protein n=1 Tax=Bimuria novae-zelandiae CBS 107.79 TaxID=1447943 RepID=A0A6A5V4S1_9PLEO|nr:hypothetical protein BU23DRAFT_569792 [Bimuria novae-zelandiae CBS 107.79]
MAASALKSPKMQPNPKLTWTADDPNKLCFMDFPGELRNRVYALLLEDPDKIRIIDDSANGTPRRANEHIDPSILRVRKAMIIRVSEGLAYKVGFAGSVAVTYRRGRRMDLSVQKLEGVLPFGAIVRTLHVRKFNVDIEIRRLQPHSTDTALDHTWLIRRLAELYPKLTTCGRKITEICLHPCETRGFIVYDTSHEDVTYSATGHLCRFCSRALNYGGRFFVGGCECHQAARSSTSTPYNPTDPGLKRNRKEFVVPQGRKERIFLDQYLHLHELPRKVLHRILSHVCPPTGTFTFDLDRQITVPPLPAPICASKWIRHAYMEMCCRQKPPVAFEATLQIRGRPAYHRQLRSIKTFINTYRSKQNPWAAPPFADLTLILSFQSDTFSSLSVSACELIRILSHAHEDRLKICIALKHISRESSKDLQPLCRASTFTLRTLRLKVPMALTDAFNSRELQLKRPVIYVDGYGSVQVAGLHLAPILSEYPCVYSAPEEEQELIDRYANAKKSGEVYRDYVSSSRPSGYDYYGYFREVLQLPDQTKTIAQKYFPDLEEPPKVKDDAAARRAKS